MKKATLVLIALATATLFGGLPAQATDGPWCGVYSIGGDSASEKCDYRDFESCRMDIIAGNRGFCRQNGYWHGNTDADSPRPRKSHKQH